MAAEKDKKRRTWTARFYYENWKGERKEKRKRGFATKAEALAYEHDFKKAAKLQVDITLGTLAEKYLQHYAVTRKASSLSVTSNRINKYILPDLRDMKIKDITVQTIEEWQKTLPKKNISESMIRSVNVAFSALLNYATKNYNLPKNPFSGTTKTGKIRKKQDFWELDEYLAVAEFFDDIFDQVVFNTLFWTGMRIGELEALQPKDINFKANTFYIHQSYNPEKHVVGPPKTPDAERTIHVPSFVMEIIHTYLDSLAVTPEYPFLTLARPTLRGRLARYAHLAGVKRITLHDLRHSHASYLIHQNASLPMIAKRLGHSSPEITLRTYAHCYKTNELEIIQEIENTAKIRPQAIKEH